MPKFKYQNQLDELNCDLDGYTERERDAFRWVFNKKNHPNNFLPRYLIKTEWNRTDCEGWALSLFETENQAVSRMKDIANGRQLIYKKLGTHVSYGRIVESDSVSNDADNNGHFSLFEYEGVDLSQKFKITRKI